MPIKGAGKSAGGRGRTGRVRLMAFTVPGLAGELAGEIASLVGMQVDDVGHDGRSDVVLFTAEAPALRDVLRLRLAEDICVEVGRATRAHGDQAKWIADRLWHPERSGKALEVRAKLSGPARARATFRVITRVLQERSFLRTDFRRRLSNVIQLQQPRWQFSDPASLEVWAVEYQPGKFVAGLRISDASMRQHGGRAIERGGALRPTAAAAMVRLAGDPGGRLLDPCCGSGTILAEAARAGWRAEGLDIDPEAVRIARRNAPGVPVAQGDVRELGNPDGSVDACVSNLPFGKQFDVQQDMSKWLRIALAELTRVTRSAGRIVVMAPIIPRTCVPAELALASRIPIRLLGTKTSIWVYDRKAEPPPVETGHHRRAHATH
jgi:23S rRNA G2445 N2-methylase RlmL